MTEGDAGSARNFRSAYYEKLGFCGSDEKNYLELLIEASPFDDDKLNDLCERPELDRKCIEAWKILLGVECDRKNPFDDYANVKRVRSEHFQLLKHHLEVLLKHNLLMNKTRSTCSQQNDEQQQPMTKPHKDEDDGDDDDGDDEKHDDSCKESNQNLDQYHHKHHHHSHQENDHKTRARADHARLITLMYLLETGRLDTLDIDGQLKLEESRKLLPMAAFFVNVADDLQEAFFLFRNFTNHIQNKTTS
uniref:TBC1 domain family member 7 n=1 Tax=Aceria tosichella TaxID=561515 RepID=A0A6G1SMC2_9ACAR